MNREYQSPYCSRLIHVTNKGSNDNVGGAGNTIVVAVADTCPGCGENDLDFAVGVWNVLTDNSTFAECNLEW
jgi:hypothetical protein